MTREAVLAIYLINAHTATVNFAVESGLCRSDWLKGQLS